MTEVERKKDFEAVEAGVAVSARASAGEVGAMGIAAEVEDTVWHAAAGIERYDVQPWDPWPV